MNKIWINEEKGEDKIIGFGNNHIYKINPKEEKILDYAREIENNNISDKVLSIPFSYLKGIEYQEGKKYILIYFGQESEEQIRINNIEKRFEIFKHFKDNLPNSEYDFEKYSALKAGKKPLIAVVILSILFAWSFSLALNIESGYEYELVGSGRGITGIVLALANLGTVNLFLIFGILIGIGVFSMVTKMRKKPSVHTVFISR